MSGEPFDIATGDFDGDDDVDLVTAIQNTNTIEVLTNAGDGTFTTGTAPSSGGTRPRGVAVGDVNGDDDLDVVVANSGTDVFGTTSDDTVRVLLGDGAGGLALQPETYAVGERPRRVVLGDFDGDDRLDIATANSASTSNFGCPCTDSVSVLLNDPGTPGRSERRSTTRPAATPPLTRWQPPTSTRTATSTSRPPNRLGMLVGPNRALSVLAGDGAGAFGSPGFIRYSADSDQASITAIAVADLNNDTRLDLVSQNVQCCVEWSLNTTPIARDDDASFAEDSSANAIDVLANDIDVGTVDSVETSGTYGTVDIDPGGTGVAYTPDTGYCNDGPGTDLPPDTFTYTTTAGPSATVSVTVTCDSDPDTYYVETGGLRRRL